MTTLEKINKIKDVTGSLGYEEAKGFTVRLGLDRRAALDCARGIWMLTQGELLTDGKFAIAGASGDGKPLEDLRPLADKISGYLGL